MKTIDARVTGFDYTTFHAYRTEVEVDGREWTLAVRYNTFLQFYTRLTALEKHFSVAFPPKGGLFFSPPPEERQEQLDDFLLGTLAYFDMRGHPKRMATLLDELLEIPEHLAAKDDSDDEDKRTERTASEGSSVADELLMDTPMPARDSAHNQGFEPETPVDDEAKTPKEETPHEGVDLLKVFKAKATFVSGAIQAAVVNTMQENVQAKQAEKTEDVEEIKEVEEVEEKTVEPDTEANEAPIEGELEEKVPIPEQPAAELAVDSTVEMPATKQEAPAVESEPETSVEKVQTAAEPVVEAEAVAAPVETAAPTAESTLETAVETTEPVKEVISAPQNPMDSTAVAPESVEKEPAKESTAKANDVTEEVEVAAEPVEKEAEGDHPVVSWFRRLGTFGQSSGNEEDAAKNEEAPAAVEDVVEEDNPQGEMQERPQTEAELEAEALVSEQAATAARSKAEAEAEAEFLQAQEEMDKRLRPYRHPVFFQCFNCDIGTSRFSSTRRLSTGVLV